VLAPRSWSEAGNCEHWWMNTDCLIETSGSARLFGTLRFLQLRGQTITQSFDGECDTEDTAAVGECHSSWSDHGVEREVDFELALEPGERSFDFAFEPESKTLIGWDSAAGGGGLETRPIVGRIKILIEFVATALMKVSIRTENLTRWEGLQATRDEVLHGALLGAHTLLAVVGGSFVSLTDPPAAAQSAAASCANVRTWPVLIGEPGQRTQMLSAPIILPDYPAVAPESPGDMFDATEIDEVLTLRTMTLTDEEKREARATDPRAAALLDRVDAMPPEILERLHGAMRYVRGAEPLANITTGSSAWANDAASAPETDSVQVAGVALCKGRRVRLCPGIRRADAHDMFLQGRVATVQGVYRDLENRPYLAVSLDEDPATEFLLWHGRYLYFSPDEVEPLERCD
jgi:hypothetical protein